MRVTEVDRADPPDALRGNLLGIDAHAERNGREQRQFGARVKAIHVGRRIGLGIAQPLSFGENRFEGRAVLLNFGEDVIAGPVEDAEDGLDAISADPLAQGGVNWDPPTDRGFHSQLHTARGGPAPDFHAFERDQFLVRRDHALAVGDGALDHFARHSGAADQLSDNVDARVREVTSRQSSVISALAMRAGKLLLLAVRLQTAATFRRNPSFSAIWSAFSDRMVRAPIPTLPRPTMPTFTSCIKSHDSSELRVLCRLIFCLYLSAFAGAQQQQPIQPDDESDRPIPATSKQIEDMLKADHEKNLKDLEKMAKLVEEVQTDTRKNARDVISMKSIRSLEQIEKLSRTIRGRMKRY